MQFGAAQPQFLGIDGTQRLCIAGLAKPLALVDGAAFIGRAQRGEMIVEPAGHDLLHQRKPVKGVARIGDAATAIGLAAILLDIAPRQRRSAQHDRQAQSLARHLFEVFPHHHGRFDQQARHADGVGLVPGSGFEDRGERLLDAEIDDLVAVIGEDDVDEVLADVVDVALHRRQHDGAALMAFLALHERFEIGDRRLHRLGRLQHEGQLHPAGAEEFADDLHAMEEEVVDDLERGVFFERLGEIVLEAEPVALDDAPRQARRRARPGVLSWAARRWRGRGTAR